MQDKNVVRNHQRAETSQNSDYPESREDSRLKIYQKSYLNQLSQIEQQIVNQYLKNAQNKNKKVLISERDELLQELHQINDHLTQIIDQLQGTISQLSHYKLSTSNLSEPKSPNSQANIVKKYNKLHKSIIQPSPSNIKSNQKDELKNLNSNQLDQLQQKNLKLMISLEQQIQDYEFMLTGEYWDKLDQEIEKQSTYKKQIQQDISFLNKTVHKYTKTYDKEMITKLEKQSYDKQVELTLLTKKLQSKLNKLDLIERQSKQKVQKTRKLQEQENSLLSMVEMYEDEQYQGPQSGQRKKEKFQKLLTKKQRLQKVINSLNTNNLKLYNKKLSDFRSLHYQINQYNELSKQVDYNILILTKQRKQFQQKNQHLLNKSSIVSSIINQFQQKKKISQFRQQPSDRLNTLSNVHKKSKAHSQYNEKLNQNQKFQAGNYSSQSKVKHLIYTSQKTIEQPIKQNHIRRRVYTELQNSHYFSSLAKKPYNKKLITQEEYPTSKNDEPQRETVIERSIVQQKKFNSGINNPVKVQNRNHRKSDKKEKFKNKIQRKGDSIERDSDSVDQIQERLRKLENFLKKDQITLEALQKIQKRLHSTKANQKKLTFDQSYISEPQQQIPPKKISKSSQRSQQRHYKELCDRLGKNKLLIEQDVDISGLIYQGMSKKNQL